MATSAFTGASVTDEKPTVLIVQGCFQTPLVYESLSKGLLSKGYPTVHPRLPTCTDPDDPAFPSLTLVEDALAIRHELIHLIEYQYKTVVVVMHSYGGLVGSEAIPEDLSYSKRQTQGLPGGVIHLFYISAFILDTLGESPNNEVKPDGRFTIRNGESTLYNDLPPSEASYWASRLIPQSYKVQLTRLTRAAYRCISSTYLICENDQAVPVKYQEAFAAATGAHVERCSSGHSPMLSQPEMLVRKIVTALEEAISEQRAGESQ